MRGLAGLAALLLLTAPGVASAGLTKSRPLNTGQTTSYGAVGDTTKGVTRSYVDLGGGVIKDQKTGLFWEVKSDDGSIHDKDAVYTWTIGTEGASGSAFTQFLAQLNCTGSFAAPGCTPFGGFADWRLPTRLELETLLDLGTSLPCAPPAFNRNCTPGCTVAICSCTRGSGGADYWSSSTLPDPFPSVALIVTFDGGSVLNAPKTDEHFVRAVRGGTGS